MSSRWARHALGVVLAAVLPLAAAAAQQVPRDTSRTPRDTAVTVIPLTALDSVRRAADTLQAPFAQPEMPRSVEIGAPWAWDREAIFESGAMTLLDLLERVPGLTGFRTGWMLAPEAASWVGAFGRVRVFQDGIELAPLDARLGGQLDLSTIELWPLEEIRLEPAAGELRVHLRTWRVHKTTPDTRADVSTGDFRSNLFRGFYGRRWRSGMGLQVGAQQQSTLDPRGVDGDQLTLFARSGWARGPWSVDAFALTASRLRNAQPRLDDRAPLPPLDAQRGLFYVRAGYGSPEAGPWAQVVGAVQRFSETSEDPGTDGRLPRDTVDTLNRRAQVVGAAGYTRGPGRVSVTLRATEDDDERYYSPALRLGWEQRLVAAGAYVERTAEDSTLRADLLVRLTPVPFLSLAGGVSEEAPFGDDDRPSVRTWRGEAGVRVGRLWASAGMMRRSDAEVLPPIVFDRELAGGRREASGLFGQLRGPLWRDVSAAVTAVQWDEDAVAFGYLPRREVRSEATLQTRWLRRFPSGQFGLRASIVHHWRDRILFPLADGTGVAAPASSVLDGYLEIRIQDAAITLQARNITAIGWASTPGYLMPNTLLFYGVRWQFWN